MTKYNMEKKPTVFAEGLFWRRPHEKAPDFVRGKLSISVPKLQKFIKDHPEFQSERGYINFDLLKSKDGGTYYFTVDTYKPKEAEPKGDDVKIEPEDVPF